MSWFSKGKMNSTLERAKSVLPSNFKGLRAHRVDVEGVFVTRILGCNCGSESGSVKATATEGELPYLDPVWFDCSGCDGSIMFFDSSRDGYNGRLNGGASYGQGDQPEATLCPACGSQEALLACGVAYNIDFEKEDQLDLLREAQDYFDAIDVNASCAQCSEVRHIGAWELA